MAKKTYTGRTMLATRRLSSLPGFEDFRDEYKVDNNGNILKLNGKPFSPSRDQRGYLCVRPQLKNGCYRTFRVHRAVATAFCKGYSEELIVNHIDENPSNSHPSNLEWITQQQNILISSSVQKRGIPIVGTCVRTGSKIFFNSAHEAGRNGFTQSHIWSCLNGIRRTHMGYTWEIKKTSTN